jgi:uncharacterized membrane protein YphA (DoxX/SURF4 family)
MLVSRELNAAYWALRIGLGLMALGAGIDKFTLLLVNWDKYVHPSIPQMLSLTARQFMQIAGGIEIIVGIAILIGASRVFGYVLMAWLWGIAINLISIGGYYDIVVRDIVLGISGYALARVTEARHSVLYVERGEEHRRAA